MHDLIIKGGTLVDGTGAAARAADVAVDSGRITEVGTVEGGATRTIDADGLLVTPGWVDVHTHYDGQVTWDSELAPSSWHGVTTLVMGNCGVGFAPAAPDRHDWLIGLMEGVEDIPGTALAEGIEWEWETFPEYLDALERRRWTVDVGTQVPHGAVRAYVMGERGARNEAATAEDIEAHAGHRPRGTAGRRPRVLHLADDGAPRHRRRARPGHLSPPRTSCSASGPRWARRAPASSSSPRSARPARCSQDAWTEVDWMRRLSAAIDRPVSYVLLQHDDDPELWRKQLAASLDACAEGARLYPQIAGRPTGILSGHHTTLCFFRDIPAYARAAGPLLVGRRARRRAGRSRRCGASILSWTPSSPAEAEAMERAYHRTFVLGDPPDYEPGPERSLAGLAAARGVPPLEVAYDELARDGGQGLLYIPILNYATGRPRPRARDDAAPAGTDRAGRRGRPHRDHLRRVHAHLHAHPLDAGPHPRRAAAARVRGEEADARHGAPLRDVGPRARWSRARWATSISSTTRAWRSARPT